MDDNDGNTVAKTEFAGDRQVMAEVMGQRLDGFEPLNMMGSGHGHGDQVKGSKCKYS